METRKIPSGHKLGTIYHEGDMMAFVTEKNEKLDISVINSVNNENRYNHVTKEIKKGEDREDIIKSVMTGSAI